MTKHELIHLINVLQTARNSMNERRSYADKHWEEKYRRAWDKEDWKVYELLTTCKEELDGL